MIAFRTSFRFPLFGVFVNRTNELVALAHDPSSRSLDPFLVYSAPLYPPLSSPYSLRAFYLSELLLKYDTVNLPTSQMPCSLNVDVVESQRASQSLKFVSVSIPIGVKLVALNHDIPTTSPGN